MKNPFAVFKKRYRILYINADGEYKTYVDNDLWNTVNFCQNYHVIDRYTGKVKESKITDFRFGIWVAARM
jgi:hypothetical protein